MFKRELLGLVLCIPMWAAVAADDGASAAAQAATEAGKNHEVSVKVDIDNDDQDSVSDEIQNALEKQLLMLPPAELKQYLLEKAKLRNQDDFNFGEDAGTTMTAVVAIIMVFGFPVFIVGLVVWSRYKRRQLVHQSVRHMVDKGVEIPPHLLDEEKRSPSSAMRRGIILLSLGLGLIAFFGISGETGGVGAGVIPLMIGVGYLIVWKLESRYQARNVS